jgi:hypothetical protein
VLLAACHEDARLSDAVEPPHESLPAGAIFAFDDACPAGFTERVEFANRYLRGHNGDASFGETGGAATHTHLVAAHTHTLVPVGGFHSHQVSFGAAAENTTTSVGGALVGAAPQHTHAAGTSIEGGPHMHPVATAATITSAPAANEPPFREVVLCEVTGTPTLVPVTALVLSESACIQCWSSPPDIAGRLLRGHDLDGSFAEVGGGPHVHAFDHTHGSTTEAGGDHTHTVTMLAANMSVTNLAAGPQVVPRGDHVHAISISGTHVHALAAFTGSTLPVVAFPQHREVFACCAAKPAPLPANALILAVGPCPSGWLEVLAYRNHFLRGDDGDAATGPVAGGPHAHDADHMHGTTGVTAHGHTVATNANSPTVAVVQGGATTVSSDGHAHPLIFSPFDPHTHATQLALPDVSMDLSLPQYMEVVVCKRQ